MILKTVVLPAPFGPIKPTRSFVADVQVELRDRRQAAEVDRALVELEKRKAIVVA